MSRVLVVAEHDGSEVNPSTAKTLSCAKDIANDVDLVVFAKDGAGLCVQLAALQGASRVLRVDRDENGASVAAIIAPQIVALAGAYTHILGPSTTFGKDLMPRVAALLGVGQLSDIMEVVDAHTFKRPIYAGNCILTIKADPAQTVVATTRTASYQAVGEGGAAPIEVVEVDAQLPGHTRFVGVTGGSSDRPDLQTAKIVVSGGRALGSEEAFSIIYSLADKIGAGVGASRAAVDSGYVPNDMQVGQTGKIIAPDLYLAIGISGAIQHLTGIKDAGTIVAINKDGEAPIFEVADIGLVADLFQVVPELEKLLGS